MARDIRSILWDNLKLAVKASLMELQEEARTNHRFTTRTGDLEKAIDTTMKEGALAGRVFINEQVAPYAPFVHNGSRAHMIFPRRKQALRWSDGNHFFFAKKVYHPGYKGDPFLYRALERKEKDIEVIFDKYTDKALKEVEDELTNS